jgi:hypothetical protein
VTGKGVTKLLADNKVFGDGLRGFCFFVVIVVVKLLVVIENGLQDIDGLTQGLN